MAYRYIAYSPLTENVDLQSDLELIGESCIKHPPLTLITMMTRRSGMSNQAAYLGIPPTPEEAEEAAEASRQSPHSPTQPSGNLLLSSTSSSLGDLGFPGLRTRPSDLTDHTPTTLVGELPLPSPTWNHYPYVPRQCACNAITPVYHGSSTPHWTPGWS